ncbi:MAG: TorF family putative porin [Gammaproteobacteria bacterium]|nr:TorF family putative porin [Gammaproteobacteria bacterium]
MIKPIILILLLYLVSLPAFATEFSGSVSFRTNYVEYGYTKSNNNPSGYANIDFEDNSGLFLGVSVSSIDFDDHQFNNHSSVEITPYLGWNFEFSDDWRAQFQWLRYLYDDKVFNADADYNLFSGSINYQGLITAQIAFSDNLFQQDEFGVYYQVSGQYPITRDLEFSAGIGYSMTRDALEYDYLYWDSGLTWYFPYGSLDFRYVQSEHYNEKSINHQSAWLFDPNEIDARFVFTVTLGY